MIYIMMYFQNHFVCILKLKFYFWKLALWSSSNPEVLIKENIHQYFSKTFGQHSTTWYCYNSSMASPHGPYKYRALSIWMGTVFLDMCRKLHLSNRDSNTRSQCFLVQNFSTLQWHYIYSKFQCTIINKCGKFIQIKYSGTHQHSRIS